MFCGKPLNIKKEVEDGGPQLLYERASISGSRLIPLLQSYYTTDLTSFQASLLKGGDAMYIRRPRMTKKYVFEPQVTRSGSKIRIRIMIKKVY